MDAAPASAGPTPWEMRATLGRVGRTYATTEAHTCTCEQTQAWTTCAGFEAQCCIRGIGVKRCSAVILEVEVVQPFKYIIGLANAEAHVVEVLRFEGHD